MSPLPALVAGLILLIVGGLFAVHELQQPVFPDDSSDPERSQFLARRRRRRLQTAGTIALIGLMLPIGDQWMERKPPVLAVTIFWMAVTAMVFWICLLALEDYYAVRRQLRRAARDMAHQHRVLQSELAEHRRQFRAAQADASRDVGDPGADDQ